MCVTETRPCYFQSTSQLQLLSQGSMARSQSVLPKVAL